MGVLFCSDIYNNVWIKLMKNLLLTIIGLINFCFADGVPHLFILHLGEYFNEK
jgi:hypothetical protein